MPSGPRMSHNRYMELSNDTSSLLSREEYEAGWHFCLDWDGMLIHKEWPEYESCLCKPFLKASFSEPQNNRK